MALTKVPSNLDATVATTQSASDNSTNVATTAYVTTAISNLVDSSPSALNTLNELAAALGDDANYASTTNAAIAAKLPLAGGTLTGNLGIGVSASSAIGVYHSQSLANGLAAELTNTQSSTGSGIVVKGGNNSSTYSADFRDYNNNNLMRIRGDGNVGIGTTSPGHPLNVVDSAELQAEFSGYSHASAANNSRAASGSIRLGNGAGTTGLLIDYTDQGQTVGLIKNEYVASGDSELRLQSPFLSFYTGTSAAEKMRINSSGTVLIGNTGGSFHSSVLPLIVGSGSGDEGMAIYSGSSNKGKIGFADAATDDSGSYRGYFQYDHSDDSLRIGTAGSERLRINGGDHIGFGTTDIPSGMSSSSYKQFKIGGAVLADSGHASGHNVELMNNLHVGSGNDRKFTHAAAASAIQMTGGKIYFRTHDGGGASANATATVNQRMQIHSNGRVAIGDHTPEGPLDIKGGSYNSIILGSNRTDNTNKLCGITSYMYTNNKVSLLQGSFANGANALYYGSADGAYRGINNHYFYVNSNYNATSGHKLAMRINSVGMVYMSGATGSMGTPSFTDGILFTYKDDNEPHLEHKVNHTNSFGVHKYQNSNGTAGSISMFASSVAYNTSSDYRLKEDVNYTWDATSKLKQLKPCEFKFKADSDDVVHQGFLAHEVDSIVPNSVSGEKDGEEMQQLDHSKLVPLLVKTIQELEARVKELEG